MTHIQILYSIVGGIGLFFYGMRTVTDSLQSLGSNIIKNVVNSLTRNRIIALFIGIIVTMFLQTASITSIMVVGFVNAGLMTLNQAMSVAIGSNIGATISTWIISSKVSEYGILLIAIGIFPTLFSKNNFFKQFGRLFFGLGLIFFGLELLDTTFLAFKSDPEFLKFASFFTGRVYTSFVASILTGVLMSALMQSSLPVVGVVISLANTGIIDFENAMSMVMGTGLGTSVSVLFASIGGNINSKRTAMGFALFNLFGVILFFPFLKTYFHLVEWIVPGPVHYVFATGERPNMSIHIAAGHTLYYILLTFLILPFLKSFNRLVCEILPDDTHKEIHHLVMLGNADEVVPATALVQVSSENKMFFDVINRMFKMSRQFIEQDGHDRELFAKINDYERISDNIQREVTVFICKILERECSASQTAEALTNLKVADELETIADYLDKFVDLKTRFERSIIVQSDCRDELFSLYNKTYEYYVLVTKFVHRPNIENSITLDETSELYRQYVTALTDRHLSKMAKGEIDAITGLIYSDMFATLNKIRGHSYQICDAIKNQKRVIK